MFKQKKYDISKIKSKLESGDKPRKMFVYTVEQQVFVDRGERIFKADDVQVEYYVKALDGCGFCC